MNFPPRLLLIGTQKAGTTMLASMLDAHPDICLSSEKEPDFYTSQWGKGFDWYRGLYSDPSATWLLDASTAYSAAFVDAETGKRFPVAQRIFDNVEDPRLIYIIRDPVSRTYSSYWHSVRHGRESLPIRDAVTPDSIYATSSYYADHLREYYRYFSREQVLLLEFEELCSDPRNVLDQVAVFLDVDLSDDSLLTKGEANVHKGYQYSAAGKMLHKLVGGADNYHALASAVRRIVPDSLVPAIKGLISKQYPKITAAEAVWLAGMFEPWTVELEELLGRKFDHWTRPEDSGQDLEAEAGAEHVSALGRLGGGR